MFFWENILRLLDTQMEAPASYGWFHLLAIVLTVVTAVLLCILGKNDSSKKVRSIVLGTAITVTILEIYKQINYSFSYESGIVFDYQWYMKNFACK